MLWDFKFFKFILSGCSKTERAGAPHGEARADRGEVLARGGWEQLGGEGGSYGC